MSCKTLITIRLLLYLCYFHKVESAAPSFTVPVSITPHGSVDENSPKDISILTVEGTDTDGDTLSYSLVTQTPISPPFSLDSITGLLKTPVGLDAEFNRSYSFTFGVSDGTTTVNSGVYTLNITDINDVTPVFQDSTNNVSLLDSVSNGDLVYDANATDADVTATVIIYSLISGNVPFTFSLNYSDGRITVFDRTQLNATLTPSYSLIVQVNNDIIIFQKDKHKNCGIIWVGATSSFHNDKYFPGSANICLDNVKCLSPTQRVRWNTYEESDSFDKCQRGYTPKRTMLSCTASSYTVPMSTNRSVSVDENSPKDVTIMTVEAACDVRNFSIVSQTPTSPPFTFDSSLGQLRTPTGLDAEFSLTYNFTFGVSDGSTTVTSVVYTVNINDINEFTPEFQETTNNVSLLDSVSNGHLVYDANATDADVTATVTYSLISGNAPVTFSLDTNDGKITVSNNTQLDPKLTPSYNLTIQASDGENTVTSMITVKVECQTPSFTVPVLTTLPQSVNESSLKDVLILTLDTVCDVLNFSIVSQTPSSPPFLLDASSGLLKTPTGLDAEHSLTYIFIFGVSDGSTTVNSVNYTVNINDINEFTPEFQGITNNVSVLDSVNNGYLVYIANATDKDATATVTYSLIAGNVPVTFSLDSSNGTMTVFNRTQLNPTSTPSYSLIIQASDGTKTNNLTVLVNVTVSCTASSYTAPVSTTLPGSVNETSPKDVTIMTVEAACDVENFSIVSQTPASPPFTLDTSSGQLKTPMGLDAEFSLTYNFTFGVSDGSTTVTSVVYTVNINDVNEFTPEFQETTNNVSLLDSVSNGHLVYDVNATDADVTATVTYSLISGNAPVTFSLDTNDGKITVSNNTQLDPKLTPSYNLTIQASDGEKTVTRMITIKVECQTPSFTVPVSTTRSVNENSPKDVSILTLDTVCDVLNFSIVSQTPSSPPFLLDASSGLLKTPTGLDAEYSLTYIFIFGVSDGSTTVNSVNYTVNINDINEFTPEFQGITNNVSVLDSVNNGYLVYIANATDKDATATVTYSLIAGNVPVTFSLDSSNGTMTVFNRTQLNPTSTPSYSLIIQASDGTKTNNLTVLVNVTISCTASSYTAPVSTTLPGSVNETSPKDVTIMTVEAACDVENFSIVSQTPASPPFTLDTSSGQLKTPMGLDAEFSLTYNFTFGVSDGSTTVTSVVYTVNINDVNEFTPEFQETTNNVSLLDSVSNGHLVYDVNATDADVTATVTYSLISGNAPVTFSLDTNDGKITVSNNTQLDPKLTPSYNLTIQASDGEKTVTSMITIKVECQTPAFTVPVLTTLPESVNENSSEDILILTLDTVCDVLNFSIVSQTPASPPFLLNASSGLLKTPTGLDAEHSLTYIFIFGVSDDSTTVNSVSFTVNINDINEFTPEFQETTNNVTLLDSVSNGHLVYDANATDADVTATVTYSLISGNAQVTFSLDMNDGKITVSNNTLLDPKITPSYNLTIQASDGEKTVTSMITIKVECQTPSFTVPVSTTRSVNENSPKDVSILTLDTVCDVLNFSIVSQTPSSPPFVLDASSGLLKTPTGLDAEYSLTYIFIFGVSDGSTTVNSVNYTVNINDINEFTPEFQGITNNVSILDSVSNGYLVYIANATDKDATATVTYSLISGNVPVTFSLDASNGTITVFDRTHLNQTSTPTPTPSYRLIIQASDETKTNNLTVSVIVKVSCTASSYTVPMSTNRSVSVDENSPKDVTIMTVEAACDVRIFSIVSQTPTSPLFTLDSFSGQLKTPTGLDAEFSLAYNFTFGVSDGSTTVNSVNYTVNINDINEFTPEFQETTNNVSLLYSVSNGHLVYDVNATDADVTASVTYSLISGNSPVTFSLDTSNGKITVSNNTHLDSNVTPSYNLIVQASDGENTVTRMITVKVECQTPSFTVPVLTTPSQSVNENSPKDVSILTLDTVCDVLNFSIVSQTPSSPPFLLDASSGLLKTPTGLDAEHSLTYIFIFGVSDGSTTVNSVNYTVNINDTNEFTPVFQGTTNNVSLLDSVSNGYLVYVANATDKDATATVTYSFISGNVPVTFSLHSSNGTITVFDRTQLNPTSTPFYSLIIQASDGTTIKHLAVSVNVKEDFCSSSPCAHSGTCSLTQNGYNCTCTRQYIGQNCTQGDNVDTRLQAGLMIGLVCVTVLMGGTVLSVLVSRPRTTVDESAGIFSDSQEGDYPNRPNFQMASRWFPNTLTKVQSNVKV